MNKLQLRAVRPRTASTFHRRKALHGVSRARNAVPTTTLRHDAPVRRAISLRVQWVRNNATGALECRWLAEPVAEPLTRRAVVDFRPAVRMPRLGGMRPPSR
ncbi:hypothetical protein ACFFJT_11195 [Dyella flava]|uniref:Uncharacterized protein n=1 Tax=Dyella flava TaxID=1920170 RepID=A0ABS2JYD2_9GAMM|nr:hypothetical protein [Dyella flava]MBM7124005.1 hypothetical protein [Dyella flava]GLQ50546.1 hypothetical protein GCM10010872_19950 [Dyella flava]